MLFFCWIFLSFSLSAQNNGIQNFDTPHGDILNDIVERNGQLYIEGSQVSSNGLNGALTIREIQIKIDEDGNFLDTIISSSFNGNNRHCEVFISFGTNVIECGVVDFYGFTNGILPKVNIRITDSLNQIQIDTVFKVNDTILDYEYVSVLNPGIIQDSVVYFVSATYKNNDYQEAYLIRFDLRDYSISKDLFPHHFLPTDYHLKGNKLYVISNFYEHWYYDNIVAVYDLRNMHRLLIDTLPKPFSQNSIGIWQNENQLAIIGRGLDFDPYTSIGNNAISMCVVDSNLNILMPQIHFPITNSSVYTWSFIKGLGSDYFMGASLEHDLDNTTYDTLGYLIVKTDSLFKKQWQCIIPKQDSLSNGCSITKMLPTSDGGLLVLFFERDGWNDNLSADSYLAKINSNGQIVNLKTLTFDFSDFSLYPNPTSQYVNLELPNSSDLVTQVEILDMNGKTLVSRNVQSTRAQIDVANLSKGVYFVLAFTQSGMIIKEKFVKE
jgi:hypothetical protein